MGESGLFQRVMSHKQCQIANFENGVTNIQRGILQVLLNILSISSLPKVNDMPGYFGMQKE